MLGYIVGRDATVALFARVVSPALARELELADQIVRPLTVRPPSPVLPLVPPGPQPFMEGAATVAYPFVDARYCAFTADDMRTLGSQLALLHRALAGTRHAEAVRHRWLARRSRLERRMVLVMDGSCSPGPEPDRLIAYLRQWSEAFLDVPATGQPLHGDVNVGNVLYADGTCVLIDLEELASTWGSPVADVAAAVERFAVAPWGGEPARQEEATRALLQGYAGIAAPLALDEVVIHLAAQSLRALLVLSELEAGGQPTHPAEWQKFFKLLHGLPQVAACLRQL